MPHQRHNSSAGRAALLLLAVLVAGGVVVFAVLQSGSSPPPAGVGTDTRDGTGDGSASGVPDAAAVGEGADNRGTPVRPAQVESAADGRVEGTAPRPARGSGAAPGGGAASGQEPLAPMSPGAGPHMRRGADVEAEGTAGGKSMVEWQQLLGNQQASTEERLQALSTLRVFGAEGWNEPTLRAAIGLGKSAEEPRVRASAWAVLLRVRKPELVEPLLHAVQNDPDPMVRRAAAQTLVDYVERADVSAVLQRVKTGDADPAVRGQAARSLQMGQQR